MQPVIINKRLDMTIKREAKQKLNVEKFKNLLLYVAEKCSGNPKFGETVFYKLLYFIDFDFYETTENMLTGETYLKRKFGPVPKHFQDIVEKMIKDEEIKRITVAYHNKKQKRYIPLVGPDVSRFSSQEMLFIDNIIDKLKNYGAVQIEDYSHEDVPFKTARDNKPLDYEMVFYRTPRYSVREYATE